MMIIALYFKRHIVRDVVPAAVPGHTANALRLFDNGIAFAVSQMLVRELSSRGLRIYDQLTIELMSETVRIMRKGDIRLSPATMLTGVRVSVQ
jgi:hypothetical protein